MVDVPKTCPEGCGVNGKPCGDPECYPICDVGSAKGEAALVEFVVRDDGYIKPSIRELKPKDLKAIEEHKELPAGYRLPIERDDPNTPRKNESEIDAFLRDRVPKQRNYSGICRSKDKHDLFVRRFDPKTKTYGEVKKATAYRWHLFRDRADYKVGIPELLVRLVLAISCLVPTAIFLKWVWAKWRGRKGPPEDPTGTSGDGGKKVSYAERRAERPPWINLPAKIHQTQVAPATEAMRAFAKKYGAEGAKSFAPSPTLFPNGELARAMERQVFVESARGVVVNRGGRLVFDHKSTSEVLGGAAILYTLLRYAPLLLAL